MQTDVIIIGAGISAKLTALYLSLHRFKVVIFPNQAIKEDNSNLVTFLSSGSIKFKGTNLLDLEPGASEEEILEEDNKKMDLEEETFLQAIVQTITFHLIQEIKILIETAQCQIP